MPAKPVKGFPQNLCDGDMALIHSLLGCVRLKHCLSGSKMNVLLQYACNTCLNQGILSSCSGGADPDFTEQLVEGKRHAEFLLDVHRLILLQHMCVVLGVQTVMCLQSSCQLILQMISYLTCAN